ncbi:MAG TPA: riboflavin synthase [Candidatus Polarisedimenticolaceae bacterium]|nr:riboflavin synthase [Candidatus Polarisedimenticolaceae bacterium]
MFTGLIEVCGKVARVERRAGLTRVTIKGDLGGEPLREGESIAVDGACLTVAKRHAHGFDADVVRETLSKTTLGALAPGDAVHLERALALGDRLGGHLVQGHVDAVAEVLALSRRGGDVRLTASVPAAIAGLVAMKGSIALQGVSLTVSGVTKRSFEVALIPETLERTKLGRLRPGDALNVEADLIARYLDAWMRGRTRSRSR